jgi:hypothetical protein
MSSDGKTSWANPVHQKKKQLLLLLLLESKESRIALAPAAPPAARPANDKLSSSSSADTLVVVVVVDCGSVALLSWTRDLPASAPNNQVEQSGILSQSLPSSRPSLPIAPQPITPPKKLTRQLNRSDKSLTFNNNNNNNKVYIDTLS